VPRPWCGLPFRASSRSDRRPGFSNHPTRHLRTGKAAPRRVPTATKLRKPTSSTLPRITKRPAGDSDKGGSSFTSTHGTNRAARHSMPTPPAMNRSRRAGLRPQRRATTRKATTTMTIAGTRRRSRSIQVSGCRQQQAKPAPPRSVGTSHRTVVSSCRSSIQSSQNVVFGGAAGFCVFARNKEPRALMRNFLVARVVTKCMLMNS
jgi:hypothetical protein